MKRILIAAAAAVATCGVAIPAFAGLSGNPSFSERIPVRVPSTAQVVHFDDRGKIVDDGTATNRAKPAVSPTSTEHSRGTEPGDDNGGARTSSKAEPGDDNGGARTSSEPEPADDNGAARTSTEPEPADDNGAARTSSKPEPADDNGGQSARGGSHVGGGSSGR
jgi:hypothetical protein